MSEQIVFVGGLHRSGTSMLYRTLGTHKNISIFSGTGVVEDEGQFLQTVMSVDAKHGGPGLFALDTASHLTERNCWDNELIRHALMSSWGPYWDLRKPILAEKSPANIIRSRFLQAVFEEAKFIFILRHPIPVIMATSKWTGAYMHTLLRNWMRAHETMQIDRQKLKASVAFRFEDLEVDSDVIKERLERLLGEKLYLTWPLMRPGVNKKYINSWWRGEHRIATASSRAKMNMKRIRNLIECVVLAFRFETQIRKYGYSFFPPYILKAPGIN